MLSNKIKSEVNKKRQEAIDKIINMSGSNVSDYRYQQGLIHGMDLAVKEVLKILSKELEDDD